MKIKTSEGFTRAFEVTAWVLQGEILSPYLFLLFLVDMEVFFRDRQYVGVNIDNISDLLMLLYAGDFVIFADTKRSRKITVLREYCKEICLSVNTEKTKIVDRPGKLDRFL